VAAPAAAPVNACWLRTLLLESGGLELSDRLTDDAHDQLAAVGQGDPLGASVVGIRPPFQVAEALELPEQVSLCHRASPRLWHRRQPSCPLAHHPRTRRRIRPFMHGIRDGVDDVEWDIADVPDGGGLPARAATITQPPTDRS
jgi:hypothetical protein